MTIRGLSGTVEWGYHCAARLGPWTISDDTLTATVVWQDDTYLSQSGLSFVWPRGSTRWAVESTQIAGLVLTARLGPQEQ